MYWIIGDIHGFYDPLKTLIMAIERFHDRHQDDDDSRIDKLIFLGDYIDYGFCSKEVIDLILSLKYEKVLLMGNHDDMLLQFVNHGRYFEQFGNVWFRGTGGQTTVNSLTRGKKVPLSDSGGNYRDFNRNDFKMNKKYRDFFNSLRYSYQEEINGENFIFIHGGLDADKSLEKQLKPQTYEEFHKYLDEEKIYIEDSTLWLKKEPVKKFGNNIVVHGHLPTFAIDEFYSNLHGYKLDSYFPFCKFEETEDRKAEFYWSEWECPYENNSIRDLISINIDTGSVFGKKLTAIGIKNDENEGLVKDMVILQVATGKGFRNFTSVLNYRRLNLQH